MALNIGEANAANVLLRYILGGRRVTREQLVEAGALLAKGSNKALGAGYSEADVREALKRKRLQGLSVPSENRG